MQRLVDACNSAAKLEEWYRVHRQSVGLETLHSLHTELASKIVADFLQAAITDLESKSCEGVLRSETIARLHACALAAALLKT